MGHKIFMNFVEILKFLRIFEVQIFEVRIKEIRIDHNIYSKTLNFFIVCVNHNEQHNGG
jgi:hypothetical protein